MLFRRREPIGWRQRLDQLIWPQMGWRRTFAYFRKRTLRLPATAHQIAAGVAAGVFCAFTPFIGVHLIASFILAWLIGGNLVAATLGIAVGNPLTVPFFLAGDYEVGRFVMEGGHLFARAGEAGAGHPPIVGHSLLHGHIADIWPILEPMLIGWLPLGLAAALAAYAIVYPAAAAFQRRRRERIGGGMAAPHSR